MIDTLTYDNGKFSQSNGWVSRYSYSPDWMVALNSNLYSFKNGNLYIHDSDAVARCTFYGVKYPSSITTDLNDSPYERKVFQSLHLRGDDAWSAVIDTDLNSGAIDHDSFVKKESDWFAYVRRVDSTVITSEDATALSTQGIGLVDSYGGNVITFTTAIDTSSVAVGDLAYRLIGPTFSLIGDITAYGLNTISVNIIGGAPVAGNFIVVGKNKVAESPGMRGYYMRVTLSNDNDLPVELFAVSSHVFKSYP